MFEIEFLAVWTDPLGTTQTIRCFSVLSSVLNQSPSRLLCETYPTADGSHRHAGEHPSAVSSLSALAWSWTTPIISRAVLSIFVFLNVLFSVDCWQIHIHTHVYIYIYNIQYIIQKGTLWRPDFYSFLCKSLKRIFGHYIIKCPLFWLSSWYFKTIWFRSWRSTKGLDRYGSSLALP